MPSWMLIHGILLVLWSCVYFSVYYAKSWTLSAPFNRTTSMKIVFILLLPLSWLISSVFLGITLFLLGQLKSTDIIFLVIIPLVLLLIYGFYLWLSNQSYTKQDEILRKKLVTFKENCQEWTKQFSFINEDNIDLEIFISKDKPVGRMIIYDLDSLEESILKKQLDKIPSGLTIMFSKKKWIPNKLKSNILFENLKHN